MPTGQTENSTEEVYKVVYEIHIHFEKDCGIKEVTINNYQTGKPGGDPPPPPPGTGPN